MFRFLLEIRMPNTIEEIRRYVLIRLLSFLMFPFYGALILWMVGEERTLLIIAFLAPYVGLWIWWGIRDWFVRCPRCGQPFFRDGIWFSLGFKCPHCGLSIF